MKNVQTSLAALASLLTACLLAAAVFVRFALPGVIAAWGQEDRSLSLIEKLTVNIGMFYFSFQLLILPILLLAFLASLAWLILAMSRGRAGNKIVRAST